MTTEEVKKLYEALIEYRKSEDPRIPRTYYWHDPYMGTEVNYRIEEYNLICKFFMVDNNQWELVLFVQLHNDARMNLCDPISFTENKGLEIPDQIDQMIAALREMPPVIEVIKNQFKEIRGGTYD